MQLARILTMLIGTALLAVAASTTNPINLDYPNNEVAQAAWKGDRVCMAEIAGRRALWMGIAPTPSARGDRGCWDLPVRLDLSTATGIEFDAYCADLSPISHFSIYMHSADGWYAATFTLPRAGRWTTCRIRKTDFEIEGRPGGWTTIDTIRISAWLESHGRTAELYLREMQAFGGTGPIAVIRAESSKPEDGFMTYANTIGSQLEKLGLGYTPISDLDLKPADLDGKTLVILPFNPELPLKTLKVLNEYLRRGGKMLAFYQLPVALSAAAGIAPGQYIGQKEPGDFASIRPMDRSGIVGLPTVTAQASWNITAARPMEGRGKIVAEWFDKNARNTHYPAIVASDNCVLMTHVLLPDDATNKQQLLLAMIGHFESEAWKQASAASISRIGKFGPYTHLKEMGDGLQQATDEVRTTLAEAAKLQATAEDQSRAGKFIEAMQSADAAQRKAIEACCLAQPSANGEHRAFWCHSAFGVQGMNWDEAIRRLKENGFTVIHPNMLWGGLAFYPSKVLPVSPEIKGRDPLAECLAACRKYGLTCHVWKVNWALGGQATPAFIKQLRAESRLQKDSSGREMDWLCPSHPANRKLEIDAMVEVATKYDVDGIHYDYIRYPNDECCFCDGCRERFEKRIGGKMARWPDEVRKPGDLHNRWLDFRRSNITAVVAEVSQRVRPAKPHLKISAAVFSDWPANRDAIGQDWGLWCEKGYLDFVCPMDYTPSPGLFRKQVERQVQWAGKAKCYPGIGYSCWADEADLFTLFEEVQTTRELKTGGFTIFNFDPERAAQLPLLGLGLTKP